MRTILFVIFGMASLVVAETPSQSLEAIFKDPQIAAIIAEAYRQESQAKTDYLRHLESQDVYDRIRAGRYGYVIPPNGIYVNPQNTMRVDNPVSGFNDNLLERLYK